MYDISLKEKEQKYLSERDFDNKENIDKSKNSDVLKYKKYNYSKSIINYNYQSKINLNKIKQEDNNIIEKLSDFYGVEGKSDVPLLTTPSQFPILNEIDNIIEKAGGRVKSFCDKNFNFIYKIPFISKEITEKLKSKNVPYEIVSDEIIVLETDLMKVFKSISSLRENPIIEIIISMCKEDYSNKVKFCNSLEGCIDSEKASKYISDIFAKYIELIAYDVFLYKQALNFKKLSEEEKISFAEDILYRINKNVFLTDYRIKIVFDELEKNTLGIQSNMGIRLNKNSELLRDFDQFLCTLAHENIHLLDRYYKAFLNKRQVKIGICTYIDPEFNKSLYRKNILEFIPFGFEEFYSMFIKEYGGLINLISALREKYINSSQIKNQRDYFI